MSKPKADLHLHTVFSDGFVFPNDLAKKVSSLDSITLDEVLERSGLSRALGFFAGRGEKEKEKSIMRLADRGVEVAKCISTVSVLDHNTVLGAEEFIASMENYAPEKRVIVGAELTALADFLATGTYPLHVIVYFYDDAGFDMLGREKPARDRFFRTIANDYLPLINRAARANNYRFTDRLRKRCNDFFFDGEEVVKEDELLRLAESRVCALISPDSVINLNNSTLTVFQTDIADYLSLTGIEGIGAEITQKYFTRESRLYVPLEKNEFTIEVDDLIAELDCISRSSEVKVKKGIAHPATYVRVIAKKLLQQCGQDTAGFYNKWVEDIGRKQVFNMVKGLAERGVIDFIESDYPRNYMQPPPISKEAGFRQYLKFIEEESAFVKRQRDFWRQAADDLGLMTSGGSDAHFRRGTPNLGYGFCDLDFDDSRVDKLFRE